MVKEDKDSYIYLDNAATTKTSQAALEAMKPYFDQYYGNPSSVYEFGNIGREVMSKGREVFSKIINCDKDEIYYTSGGTESDNFAIKQVCEKYKSKGNHIITSSIEHHAILHSCQAMEKKGFRVTYVKVDKNGIINLNELENAITRDTILISIMHANNEIGTIQPLHAIGRIAKKYGILFHTDAVQSFCHIPIDVKYLNIDLLSASGHKFGGPKGVGFMYVKKGLELDSFMHGGSQEKGLRAGTGNTAGAAGMTEAAKQSYMNMRNNIRKEKKLRDYLIYRLTNEIPFVYLNGHSSNRLPNNANFCIKYVDGAVLMVMLDLKGICISTGSACTQGNTSPSHVLLALGLGEENSRSSIRITISSETTIEEINFVIEAIKEEVQKLRAKSEEYEKVIKMYK